MSLAAKLQLKPGQPLRVINCPRDVDLKVDTTKAKDAEAVIVFVKNRAELSKYSSHLVRHARDDRLAWIAYPKAGLLGTDLNRDILWKMLEEEGVRPVRQVAVDDTWSALRFRPA